MIHGLPSSRRSVSVDDVDERDFPIWGSDPEEILSHFLGVVERRCAETKQRMNLSKEQGGPHAVGLGSHFPPVPGRRMCGVEHFPVLRGTAALHRKLPSTVVARGGEPAMPRSCVFRSPCVTHDCFPLD